MANVAWRLLPSWVSCSLLAVYTGACSYDPKPDCDSSRVTETVLRLARKQSPLPDRRFDYDMDGIKVVEQTPDSASCPADLMRVYEGGTVYAVMPITYTVTLRPDGELEVAVRGLPDT